MQQPINSKSYQFFRFSRQRTHYTDNRAGNCPHYFGYMRRGRVRLVCEGVTVEAGEGELFYIPAGCRYQSFWTGEPEICFDSLGFDYFVQEGVHYPLQKIPLSPAVRELLSALTEGEMTVNYETLGRFYLFVAAVLPYMEVAVTSRARQAVDRALAYMETAEHLSVPALARHCHISESGLYAAFRAEEGCTPLAAWQKKQIERAVFLLRTTDLPIETIAARLGYCSATYFRTVFRRVTGQTPRRIRQEKLI